MTDLAAAGNMGKVLVVDDMKVNVKILFYLIQLPKKGLSNLPQEFKAHCFRVGNNG